MKGKPGRHVPAFVLLTLSKGPAYGLQILKILKAEMPYCILDTAAIYRALNSLEETGFIVCQESIEESGVPKKMYSITPEGREELTSFYKDIKKRIDNLNYFIERYENDLEGKDE